LKSSAYAVGPEKSPADTPFEEEEEVELEVVVVVVVVEGVVLLLFENYVYSFWGV
jgi:hypothetical protein